MDVLNKRGYLNFKKSIGCCFDSSIGGLFVSFRSGGGLVPQSIPLGIAPICFKNNLFNIFFDGLSRSII